MSDILHAIAGIAVYVAAPAAILFPICYSRSPWRSTPVGKALMTMGVAVGLIFAATILYDLAPNLPGLPLAAAVLYTWLAFALWRLLFVLLRIQRRRRNDT